MKMNHTLLPAFIAFILVLTGCNNAALEEKVANLEQRVAALEEEASPSEPLALTQTVSQSEAAAGGALPKFEFEESTYDFGTINEGDEVEHTFTFTNTGNAPLKIQNASASCGCTVPSYPREAIAPGESGEILVKFNSANKPGIQNKTVRITANTDPAITRLTIKSNVVAKNDQVAGPVRK